MGVVLTVVVNLCLRIYCLSECSKASHGLEQLLCFPFPLAPVAVAGPPFKTEQCSQLWVDRGQRQTYQRFPATSICCQPSADWTQAKWQITVIVNGGFQMSFEL